MSPSLLTSNGILQGVERLGEGMLERPEDVCFDREGTLYTGTRDGWIKRKLVGNGSWEEWRFVGDSTVLRTVLSDTGGLIVCDAEKFQVDGGFPQNLNPTSNFDVTDFPALCATDAQNGLPKYAGDIVQQASSTYGRSKLCFQL